MTGRALLLHRRQFLASPHPCDAFPEWRHAVVAGLHLYAHPELGLHLHPGGAGAGLALLGFAIDPLRPERSDAELLAEIAGAGTADEVAERVAPLAGRFVLLAALADGLYVFHDPCGLRSVYYTTGGAPALASQPGLLGHVAALEPIARDGLFPPPGDREGLREFVLPAGMSPYRGVDQLVPNHYLDAARGVQVRYWPRAPLPARSLGDAAAAGAALLARLVAAAHARFPLALPLTAGWDSRMLLAASRGFARDIVAYTLLYRGAAPGSPDPRIAAEMSRSQGMEHRVIDCERAPEPWFMETYHAGVADAHEVCGRIAWGIFAGYPEGRVCLKGNCSEIARCWYHWTGLSAEPTAAELARLEPGWRGLPGVERAFDAWLREARPAARAAAVDVVDLFYWEHRMGAWQARSQLEWDIAQEVFTPFNHRPLLEILLGVPVRVRLDRSMPLQSAILGRLWPEYARWPINPLPPRQRGVVLVRRLLQGLRVLGPLRSLYRRYR